MEIDMAAVLVFSSTPPSALATSHCASTLNAIAIPAMNDIATGDEAKLT